MKVRYDRNACDGMIVCLQTWDAFQQPDGEFKPVLADADEVENGVYIKAVPEGSESEAREAMRVCPADAIEIVDEE